MHKGLTGNQREFGALVHDQRTISRSLGAHLFGRWPANRVRRGRADGPSFSFWFAGTRAKFCERAVGRELARRLGRRLLPVGALSRDCWRAGEFFSRRVV